MRISREEVMYQSTRSFNIPPGIPRAFDAFSCPEGRAFDHHSKGVGNLIASLDFMLRVVLISRRRWIQTLMNLVFPGAGHLITTHRGWGIWSLASISCYAALIPRGVIIMAEASLGVFKAKDTRFVADWLKSKGLSFALYLKVFKNHLYYLWHVRVLSIKPCLHTQLPEHNRSYWKVSRGGGFWSPGMDL